MLLSLLDEADNLEPQHLWDLLQVLPTERSSVRLHHAYAKELKDAIDSGVIVEEDHAKTYTPDEFMRLAVSSASCPVLLFSLVPWTDLYDVVTHTIEFTTEYLERYDELEMSGFLQRLSAECTLALINDKEQDVDQTDF